MNVRITQLCCGSLQAHDHTPNPLPTHTHTPSPPCPSQAASRAPATHVLFAVASIRSHTKPSADTPPLPLSLPSPLSPTPGSIPGPSNPTSQISLRFRQLQPGEDTNLATCSVMIMELCDRGNLRQAIRRGLCHKRLAGNSVAVDLTTVVQVGGWRRGAGGGKNKGGGAGRHQGGGTGGRGRVPSTRSCR